MPTRGRRILVRAIVGVTSVLAVIGIFAIWANRQMLNPDNWANTSTQLLQNADIREATSNDLVVSCTPTSTWKKNSRAGCRRR